MSVANALALAVFGIVAAFGVVLIRERRSIAMLRDAAPAAEPRPRVSVVIPARNEIRNLERALTSVLHLDYGSLEVIAIDDRSTDGTGELLDRMAASDRRLSVVHVRELPGGWLGKNHALHLGAGRASGELILFTDADVVFSPETLGRAVAVLRTSGLDHLAVLPAVSALSLPLRLAITGFAFFFLLLLRPRRIRDPRSSQAVGIGAFNLVRADVYRAAGGHAAIALRPDDDLRLGQLLKSRGARQDLFDGTGLLSVEWYASLGEMIDGLLKGCFAVLDYSVPRVVLASLFLATVWLGPFVGLALAGGSARVWCAGAVAIILATCTLVRPRSGEPWWSALAFPLVVTLFLYILWRSTLLILWRGGVRWRGTDYPLRELRANRI